MKIYFAGSIRGGRDDASLYLEIIKNLQSYGTVMTEHVGSSDIVADGESNLSDPEIHDRDMDWLMDSDIIVAEVTNPSLGVGYEIGRAVEHRKRVVCLYRENPSKRLSAMISGSDTVEVIKYDSFEYLIDKLSIQLDQIK